MNIILTISLRNLFRQKRRNILLGIAIAFGTMILVVANSFSHGISDVLFNKIVVYVAGHMSVEFTRDGNLYQPIFPDGDRIKDIVKKEVPGITQLQEAIGFMARAIGNGKSDNVIMVGIDLSQRNLTKQEIEEYKANFKMLQGNFDSLSSSRIENPVALSQDKAKYLNVKMGDLLRVRYSDVNGQSQAARLTVVCIFKPANVFMSAPIFLEVTTLKRLDAYGPHDIAQLYLRINDPKKNAARFADKLHEALKPGLAGMFGSLDVRGNTRPATMLGFRTDSASRVLLGSAVMVDTSTIKDPFGRDAVIVSRTLARALALKAGDTCTLTYAEKFDHRRVPVRLTITAVASSDSALRGDVILVNERGFYKAFYNNWPEPFAAQQGAVVPKPDWPFYTTLATEWLLLNRCKSTDEVTKQYREVAKSRAKAITVNVQSMYESASAVLKLEYALNLITFIAVMVLFFIILIGVVNTLRMTIRERTREIGTIRAIGMQKRDVRNSFVMETVFLSLFASLTGTILAFLAMAGLSRITIDPQDNPLGMLLVNSHLHFMPSAAGTVFYIALILFIAIATAYFPARRAANLSSAEALRHYE